MVLLDVMHIIDLGILQYVLASVALSVFQSHKHPGNADSKIEFLCGMVKHAYEPLEIPARERIPERKFKDVLASGNNADYPYLGAKAAVTRRFVLCLLRVIENLGLTGRKFQHMKSCLSAIVDLYEILFSHDFKLPATAAKQASAAVDQFCRHQNTLANIANANGELLFQITIKTHFLQHASLCFRHYNPRRFWNYRDEDFVGRTAMMARHVCKGVSMLQLSTVLFNRYRQRLYIVFSRRRRLRNRYIGL